jgi:serine phosphatase RsbU (regulator of sigma subunit)/DNA-binding NarL/FixJ family response regulator
MGVARPIRVLLVDDHAIVRGGLSAILRIYDDLELAGEASSGEEAMRVCPAVRPDVVLMDLIMPGMDGAATTRALREICPEVQVLVLTSFQEKELIQGALDAGAIGYLLKNVSADELATAIREAWAGRSTLAPEAAQILSLAAKLERLAQAILDAPQDVSTLPDLLEAHVPAMFPSSRIEIRLFPGQVLLAQPGDGAPLSDGMWAWVRTTREPHLFAPGAPLPWGGEQQVGETLLLAPIPGLEGGEPLGGIYLEQGRASGLLASSASLIQSLAAQIASVYHSAQTRAKTQDQRRIAQELMLAGRIQASLLPAHPPELPGWQIAAALDPALETSGDFYDFIALPGGRWGIVVADVSDKGVGAALFMALSRTLLRTYAGEYPDRADRVLAAVNARILAETRAGLFVTVFYAVLDPKRGTLTYANAGHHPPYVLRPDCDATPQLLARSGMALGVLENEMWAQETVELNPADVLLLYTDGVTDAQNPEGTAFGAQRLIKVAQQRATAGSAAKIQATILRALERFTGDAAQQDDITLVVLTRDAGDEGMRLD